jgi:hypothetical protein
MLLCKVPKYSSREDPKEGQPMHTKKRVGRKLLKARKRGQKN